MLCGALALDFVVGSVVVVLPMGLLSVHQAVQACPPLNPICRPCLPLDSRRLR